MTVRAPVTVTASEVIPSFPITKMVGTMSRSMEGFVTLSELGDGVTTSRITPSTLMVPSGLALAYGYANISYTLSWIPTWRQSIRLGFHMSMRVSLNWLDMIRKGD